MAGKGGGAWKVAYADFVTAMMAFFLVMWITAQSDQIKQAIAHHFNDPFAPAGEESEDDSQHRTPPKHAAPARTDDLEKHKEAGGGGRTLLLTNSGRERTNIGTIVPFAEDSAEIDAAGRQRLKEFAPFVLGKPQRIEIRGHSSRRPLPGGSAFRDHWQLTYTRCLAVMAELEKLGVERQRMRLSQAAGNEPPPAAAGPAGSSGQCRVEVTLLNETARLTPGQPPPAKSAPVRPVRRKVTNETHETNGADGSPKVP